jgi:hypothetical protein
MDEVLHHAARLRVRIGERFRHGVDRPGRDPGRLAPREPVRAGGGDGHALDQRLELGAMLQPLRDGVEARVGDEVREPQQRGEPRPEVVVGGADGDVAVARPERLVRSVQAMRGAEPARDLARVPVLRRLPLAQRHGGLERRGVDTLAASGAVTRAQRRQDADDGEQRGAEVGDRHAHLHGLAAVGAGRAHDPAHRLRHEIAPLAPRVRATGAEGRDRTGDEPRVRGGEGVGLDAGPPRGLRGAVLDEDVGRRPQALQQRDAGRPLEIDREAALVAVHGQEPGGCAGRPLPLEPRRRAPGRLDPDHVGAHVGEQHGAECARQDVRQVEHAETAESHHRARESIADGMALARFSPAWTIPTASAGRSCCWRRRWSSSSALSSPGACGRSSGATARSWGRSGSRRWWARRSRASRS